MSELFHKNNPWSELNEFIEAGKVTPETHMRFNDACTGIRRNHGSTESNFNRALFRVLKDRCGLSCFGDVAKQFGFSADQVPIDAVAEAPAITSEIAAAHEEFSVANAKMDAALARQQAAEARLARIDTLKEELPRLRESLEYIESFPAAFAEEIERCENAIAQSVYDLPKYSGVGNSLDFIVGREQRIQALRSAIAAHGERVKKSRAKIADVEAEISRLIKAPRK